MPKVKKEPPGALIRAELERPARLATSVLKRKIWDDTSPVWRSKSFARNLPVSSLDEDSKMTATCCSGTGAALRVCFALLRFLSAKRTISIFEYTEPKPR